MFVVVGCGDKVPRRGVGRRLRELQDAQMARGDCDGHGGGGHFSCWFYFYFYLFFKFCLLDTPFAEGMPRNRLREFSFRSSALSALWILVGIFTTYDVGLHDVRYAPCMVRSRIWRGKCLRWLLTSLMK